MNSFPKIKKQKYFTKNSKQKIKTKNKNKTKTQIEKEERILLTKPTVFNISVFSVNFVINNV